MQKLSRYIALMFLVTLSSALRADYFFGIPFAADDQKSFCWSEDGMQFQVCHTHDMQTVFERRVVDDLEVVEVNNEKHFKTPGEDPSLAFIDMSKCDYLFSISANGNFLAVIVEGEIVIHDIYQLLQDKAEENTTYEISFNGTGEISFEAYESFIPNTPRNVKAMEEDLERYIR